jgi:hypothetical protein
LIFYCYLVVNLMKKLEMVLIKLKKEDENTNFRKTGR